MKQLKRYLLCLFVIQCNFLFSQNEAPDISLVFHIQEGTANGTLIGTISASDIDGDDLTFTITSGNTNDAFTLDASTGDLTVADENELVFATNPQYELMIDVDDGNGGVVIASVIINVTERPLGFKNENKFLIYPNPVTTHFFIELKEDMKGKPLIHLYSMNGQEVTILTNYFSNHLIQIETDLLKSGTYMIRVQGKDNDRYLGRVVVK